MSLPKFYKHFYNKQVFTFADFKQELGDKYSEQYLRKKIADFIRSKYVGVVKPGLYYIVPQGQTVTKYVPDKFLVASKLTDNAVIKFHSALELHGVAYSDFNTVYVAGDRSFHPFKFQDMGYFHVKSDQKFGTENVVRNGIEITVTNRERTIIDGIQHLKYSGSIEEYFKSVEMFPSVDVKKVLKYLRICNKKVLFHKVGFVLSYFFDKWNVSEKVVNEIRSNLSRKTYYLTTRKEKSKFNNKWNLMVPARFENLVKEQCV
jgi:predicted transcriptional regulator of viral defense system